MNVFKFSFFLLFFYINTASASDFRKLYSCNNNELVIDVDTQTPDVIQLVVNGKHAIDTLLFSRESENLNFLIDELNIKFYNNGNTMVIPDLAAYKRASDFQHIYEGAGFYNATTVFDPKSVLEIEEVSLPGKVGLGNIGPYFNPLVRLDLFFADQGLGKLSSSLGGSSPQRQAFKKNGMVELVLSASKVSNGTNLNNHYRFYNCSEN